MLRQEIIDQLSNSVPPTLYSPLEDLYECFSFKNEAWYERVKLQTWLQGCIESLFYRPNKYCLILVNENDLSDILIGLSSNKAWVGLPTSITVAHNVCHDFFYTCLIDELSYYQKVKQMRSLCMQQDFIVYSGEHEVMDCDKRLASYSATVKEWNHPIAKNDLVIEVSGFNLNRFREIDKQLLWVELFHKFKIERNA